MKNKIYFGMVCNVWQSYKWAWKNKCVRVYTWNQFGTNELERTSVLEYILEINLVGGFELSSPREQINIILAMEWCWQVLYYVKVYRHSHIIPSKFSLPSLHHGHVGRPLPTIVDCHWRWMPFTTPPHIIVKEIGCNQHLLRS